MADLSITAADVGIRDSAAVHTLVRFGESVTQGQVVYKKTSDSKYWLASCDVDDPTAVAVGIVVTPGDADDYGIIVRSGKLDVGATLTVGELYVLSTTDGGIAPIGDLVSTNRLTILGYAEAADELQVSITASGVQVA